MVPTRLVHGRRHGRGQGRSGGRRTGDASVGAPEFYWYMEGYRERIASADEVTPDKPAIPASRPSYEEISSADRHGSGRVPEG